MKDSENAPEQAAAPLPSFSSLVSLPPAPAPDFGAPAAPRSATRPGLPAEGQTAATDELGGALAGNLADALAGELAGATPAPRQWWRPRPQARWVAGLLPWHWLGPLLVTLVAFLSRVINLGQIKTFIFDETYYVKDAYGLLQRGYEVQWPAKFDEEFLTGNFQVPTDPSFVVHPEVGKWMIGLGIKLFGLDPFGWRIAVCVLGSACVLITARIAYQLFGSAWLATAAAILMAVDGGQIAESRTAILDIMLEFWILVGVWAVLRDQLSHRRRLLSALADLPAQRAAAKSAATSSPSSQTPPGSPTTDPAAPDLAATDSATTDLAPAQPLTWRQRLYLTFGPIYPIRWWLVVAGVAFGLAGGVKWSAIYVVAVFGIFVFIRELSARWSTPGPWVSAAILGGGLPAFFSLVPAALVTYLVGWGSWIVHLKGWGHQPGHTSLLARLADLWAYHQQAYAFHVNVHSTHPYMSNPWTWLIQWRPTVFYYEDAVGLSCGDGKCIRAVTSVGNPIIWWVGIVALILVLASLCLRGEWRAGFIVAGYCGTYLPWLQYSDRTIFTFYTVVICPFVVLAVTYLIGVMMGKMHLHLQPNASQSRGEVPAPQVTPTWVDATGFALVIVCVVVAIFFYPVWTGMAIAPEQFNWRAWLPTWI